MAFAERLFEADLPPRRRDGEIGLSFHEESLVSRRFDFVEDSWRNFLEVYQECNQTAARAYGAANQAAHIRHELRSLGWDIPIDAVEAHLPILTNEAISFVAHTELLKHYIQQDSLPKSAKKSQSKALDDTKSFFARGITGYLALYPAEEKYIGAEDVIDSLRYASLVVLGDGEEHLGKVVLNRARKHFPFPELVLAYRDWEHEPLPPIRAVK